MISLKVISKRGGGANQVSESEILLKEASVVRVGLSKEQIKGMHRVGNDLVVTAVSGEVIAVRGFFVSFEGNRNDLVLTDDKGDLWLAEFGSGQGDLAVGYSPVDSIEPLLLHQDFNFGVLPWLIGGGLAAAGAAGGGGGGGGGSGGGVSLPVAALASPSDTTPPARPTVNPASAVSITGTAEPGTTVRVTDSSGKEIGSATVAPDGSYVVRPTTPPPHGSELRVVAVDRAGNVSPEARVTVDSVPPRVPTVTPTDGSSITGTAEPGSVVTVTDGRGNVIGSTTAGQSGVYGITPPTPPADGTVLRVVSSDAAGNASQPATATVDRTAPAGPTVNPTNGSPITGTTEPGALVTVKDSAGNVIGSATAGSNGAYSVTLGRPPVDGASISVVATDPAGNASQPTTVKVDRTAPSAPTINPTDGSPITGTAEPGSVVTVTDAKGAVIGSTTTAANGVYNFTPAKPLLNGEVIKAVAADAAGNLSAPATATVDGTPPTPTVRPTNGRQIVGTSEPDSVVTISDSKGTVIGSVVTAANGAYSLTPATPPADGTVIHVVAKDAAGNVGRPTTTTVDSRPPDAPVINPTNGNSVTGTAEAGSVVTVKDGTGKLIGSTTADSSGKFGITPSTPLAHGTKLRAVATDAVGNTGSEAEATADSVPPPAPKVDPTHGSPITGTAEPGSVVTVKDSAGNLIGSATTASNGTYSVTPKAPPANGTVLRVAATDAAGNTGPETRETVDSVPPARPGIDPTNGKTITGTAEPGSVVTIRDDSGKLVGSTVAAPSNGAYTLTPATTPAHGTVLRATATDAAGNTSPEARATVDSAPPAAPTVNPTNGNAITGTAEAGSVVTVKDSAGNLIGSTTADANGKFGLNLSTRPAGGTQISVVAADAAGNASQPATTTVDSTPPLAPTFNATSGSPITGTAEPGSVVTVKDEAGNVIGSATAAPNGAYSITPAKPPAHGVKISAIVTDAAGNASQPGTTTIDGVPPARPAIDPTNGNLITGKAEPGSVVTIKDGAGNIVGSATADASGAYSIKPAAAPAHNTVLRATAADAAGNTSPEARATVDSELPSAPKVDPTNGALIKGTAEPGSVVTVKDGAGKVIGSATADANGAYSIAPATPPAHGAVLDVTVIDSAGNTSQPATATVDGNAPGAPTISPTSGGTITGTAEPNSTVTVRDGAGKLIGSTTTDASGAYSVTPVAPLPNGTTVNVVATDAAGNASRPGTTTVDSVAPARPTIDATNGNLITGKAEPGSVVTIKDGAGNVVGSATADASGAYSIKPATVPAHNTVLRATAIDAAGNTGPEARATVDGELPSAPKVDPTRGSLITGSAEAGSVVTVKDDAGKVIGSATAGANGAYSIAPATPPAHGAVLDVTATDAAGNTSQPTSATVDSRAPGAPTVNPTNGSTVTGTAEAGSVVTARDNAGKAIGSATAAPNGNYVIDVATSPAHGARIEVVAIDAAGNASQPATATVDSVPPLAPTIEPTNGGLISGTAEPGSVVTIRDGAGNLVGSTTAGSGGAYSIKPAIVPANDTVLRAVATDAAGNASPEARTTVDGVVPNAPTIHPTNGNRIAGTAEAGSVVTVKDDAGTLVGSATANANGAYSITPAVVPAHGTVLHAVSTDTAGNTSLEATARVDRTALATPTVNPTDGSSITGTAEAGSVVTIKDGAGKLIGSTTADASGAYSLVPAAIPAHNTVLHVVATNAAGTDSPEATASVDSQAPNAPQVDPTNGNLITGTAEAGAVVRITDDSDKLIGSAIAAPNGSYSIKPAVIPAHGTVLRAVAADAAGNASPEARETVDRVLPTAPKIEPTAGDLVAGTAEANSVVTVRDGAGKLIGSATADASGAYSIKPATPLPHGTALRAVATDAAGNASPEARATVDSAPPNTPTVDPTNGNPITGTAEPGSIVTIKDGSSNVIGSAIAGPNGAYAVKPVSTPAHGSLLSVDATDAAGNVSPPATARVDGMAPGAPTVNPTNGSSITGTAEPGAVVTVKDGTGKVIGSATVGSGGTYTVNLVKPPEDGATIKVVATDGAGNASPEATATVDGQPPGRPTVNPTNGNPITGTAEPGAVVMVKDGAGNLIGSATAGVNGSYSIKPATTPVHGTALSVAATDAAGNTGPATSARVDNVAPATPVVNPTNGDPITGTAEAGALVTVFDNAGAAIGSATAASDGKYSIKPTATPADGAQLRVVATDPAGNASQPASATVDGKAPDAPRLNPTNGSSITGTAEPGSLVTVKDGSDKLIGSATAAPNGTYVINPAKPPEDGTTIKAVATDAAGNASPATTATVDNVPPAKPVVSPTNGSLISGTAEANSVVTIKDDAGRLIGSTTAAPNGTYSLAPATPPANGTVLHATATDAAGNTSSETRATVDSALPATPTVKPTNGDTVTGMAEPGSVVTVKDKAGALIGSATADADGVYTVKPATRPAHGTGLDVTAADAAGNTSPPATAIVDSKAPDAPTIAPNHGNPITGTAEPGSTVTVSDGTGKVIGSATAAADGSYSVVTTRTPEDGAKISAVATDAAGNVSPATTATVDAVPPQRPTVSPTNGGLIAGTAEANSVVTVKDDAGKVIGSATADSSGSYTVRPATPPAHGTVLHVAATDAAGNTGPETRATVDSAPPAAPTVKPTNGSTITGTAEAASVVTVKDEAGKVIGSATADAGGSYTVRPATVPAHGAALNVTATDAAGNASQPAAATVDSKAPDAPTVNPTSGSPITGTAEAGSVVTIRDDTNRLIGSTVAEASGTYSFTPGTPPANGTELRVVATDAAGNASQAGKGAVDSVAPVIGVVIIDDANKDGFINAAEKGVGVTVKVTLVSGAAAGDVINLTDGATTSSVALTAADVARGFVDVPFTSPAEGGAIQISATSRDLAGNVSRPVTSNQAVLDTTPPATPATATATDDVDPARGPVANGGTTDDTTPTFTGSGAKAGELIRLYDYGSLIGSTTAGAGGDWRIEPAALGQGNHSITHTVTDAAGNTSVASAPLDFTVDTGPVAVTLELASRRGRTFPTGFTDDTVPVLQGKTTAGAVVTVTDGTAVLGSVTADTSGKWQLGLAQQSEGAHSYKAVAVNAAGKKSEANLALTIDATPPAMPAIAAVTDDAGVVRGSLANGAFTDDTTPTLSGSGANPGDKIRIYDNGTAIGSTTVGTDGSWRFEFNVAITPLKEGPHRLTATAIDPVGNESAQSPAFTVTVDTTAPAAPAAAATSYADDVGLVRSANSTAATTDDTKPGINIGQVPAGQTPTLYVDGIKVEATYDAATGTLTPNTPIAEGEHKLSYTLSDAAGNESAQSPVLTVTVDTTAPAAPAAAPGSYVDDAGVIRNTQSTATTTDDTKPGINIGQVPAGQTPTLYVDGIKVEATYDAATGTLTPNAPIAEGEHKLSYTLSDAAGNESPRSGNLTVTVDTTPPPVLDVTSIQVLDNEGAVKGVLTAGMQTDDSKPEYIGKADSNQVSSVNVYDKGALIGSAAVHADGSWRFEPSQPLAQGDHSFTARPVDAAGNVGAATASSTFTLLGDAPSAPAITSVSDDRGTLAKNASTNDTTLTLGGTGTAGTVVTVYANDVAVGSVSVASNGTWSVTTSALSGDGIKDLSAVARDGAGQSSPATGLYPVVLDTTAPATPGVVTATDGQGLVKGSIAAGSTTDDASPVFSGSGVKAGDTIKVYDGDVLIGSITAATDGAWSMSPDKPLGEGAHGIKYTISDAAGNTSAASAPLAFTLDTKDVVVSISHVEDNQGSIKGNFASGARIDDTVVSPGAHTDDTTPTLAGKATANAVVTVTDGTTILGSATADAGGNWRLELAAQSEGAHTYKATAVNAAGKQDSAFFSLVVDTTAPAAPSIGSAGDDVGDVQSPLASGGFTDDTTPTLTGSGVTPGDVIKVYDNGSFLGSTTAKADGSWSFTAAPLTEGAHRLTATATDSVGNESAHSGTFIVNVDVTASTTKATFSAISEDTGASAGDFITSDRALVATVTLDSALEPGARVDISLDNGKTWNKATPAGGSNYQFDNTGVSLADGSYTFLARVVDAAGNAGQPSSQVVVIDNSSPSTGNAVAVTAYADDVEPNAGDYASGTSTNDTTPVLKGTVSGLKAGDVVQIREGDVLLGTATVSGATWEFKLPTLTDGSTHTYTAVIANVAGNKGTASAEFKLTVDTTAPVAPEATTSYVDDAGTQKGAGTSTNDATPGLVIGQVPTGQTPTLYVDGAKVAATYDPVKGTLTPSVPLAEGEHKLSHSLTDPAGNESKPSSEFAVTIDKTAPADPAAATGYVDDAGTKKDAGTSTNDATPGLVIGQVPTGQTPTLYVDGAKVAATYDPAKGTLTPDTPLAEGERKLSHTLTDPAGNESKPSPAIAVTVDKTAPADPAAATGYVDDAGTQKGAGTSTNDATPGLVIGQIPAGQTPTLYVDGAKVAATYDPAKGTLTPSVPLAEGERKLSYTVTDPAGNESKPSPALAVTVDTTAPQQRATITAVSDDTGLNATDFTTSDTTLVVTATVDAALNAGEKVQISLDNGATWRDATLVSGKTYQLDNTGASLAAGDYTFQARVIDAAGNTGSPSSQRVSIDTQRSMGIAIEIESISTDSGIAGDFITNDTSLTLNGKLTGTLASDEVAQISIDGGATWSNLTVANGNWSYVDARVLVAGSYDYRVRVVDTAGNLAASSARTVVIDDGSPTTGNAVAITAYADDVTPNAGDYASGSSTNDTTPTLKGTVSGLKAGEVVQIFEGNVLLGTATVNGGTWEFKLAALADGSTHTYTAAIANAAGNKGTASADFTLTVDTTAPADPAAATGYVDDAGTKKDAGTSTNDATPGLVIGQIPTGQTPTLYVDGAKVAATYDPVKGTLTPDTPLAEGEHKLSHTVTDPAGNESKPSPALTVTVDKTAPVAPEAATGYVDDAGTKKDAGTSTNDATPGLVIGQVPTGQTPTLYVDGAKVAATYDPVKGTLTPSVPLAEGEHKLSHSLTDPAGNESKPSPAIAVNIDKTAPVDPEAATGYVDDAGAIRNAQSTATTTDDTKPGINIGQVPAGQTPTLYVDGIKVEATYDAATGTLTPNTPIAEGERKLSYTLSDAAGNESAQSPALAVTVDTTAPVAPAAAPGSYADEVGPVRNANSTAATTDDTKPGINIGQVPAGQTPALYVDGTKVEATYDAATGTLTPNTPIAEGEHKLSYALSDAAGNESAQSPALAVTVDTTAPVAPATAPGSYADDAGAIRNANSTAATTDDTKPGINIGQVPAGQTPKLYVDGTKVEATYDAATGTLTPNAPLAEGEHKLSYTLSDAAGNESAQSPVLTVTLDTTAPAAPFIDSIRDHVDPVRRPIGSGGTTNDTRPELKGSGAEPDGTVNIYDDGKLIGSAKADGEGKWSFRPAPGKEFTDDLHKLTARSVDAAGNEGPESALLSFTVDTIAPGQSAKITAISDDNGPSATDFVTNDTSLVVTVTVDAAIGSGEKVQVSLDNGETWRDATLVSGNTYKLDNTGTSLAPGEHTFQARVIDAAGNTSSPSSQRVLIDTQHSTGITIDITSITTDSGVAGDFITNDTSLTINGKLTGTLAADEVAQISIDGGTTWNNLTVSGGNWSYDDGRVLTEGSHDYRVRVVDTAGNLAASNARTVEIDLTAPTTGNAVAITGFADDVPSPSTDFGSGAETNDDSPLLKGTVSGLGAGDVVKIYEGETFIGNARVTNGTWTLQLSGVSEGAHEYKAVIADANGNRGTTSEPFSLTVDLTSPEVSITFDSISDDNGVSSTTFATNDTTPTVNGTLSRALDGNEKAQIRLDSGAWSDLAVTGTAWSHTTSENLKEGKHNYEIRVVDTAGNLGAAKAQTVTIDTTPPTGNITVNALSTADTTPTITGNVSGLKADESVWVTCNGVTYKQGVDAALKVTGSTWSLAIPDSQPINKDGASDAVLSIDARIVDQAGNAKSAGSDSKITVYRDASVIRSQSYDYMAETQPALIGRGKIGTGETMFVEVADSSGNVVKKFSSSSSSSSASGVKMDAGLGSWSISPEAWGSTHLANGSYTVKAYVGVADGSGGQESGQEKFEIVQPEINNATDDKGHVVPKAYALADGSYWLFYASSEFGGVSASNSNRFNPHNLYAQRFSQRGTKIGDQVAIAATPNIQEGYMQSGAMYHVRQYDVAFKSDGSFGVFYSRTAANGWEDRQGLSKSFDASGKQIGNERTFSDQNKFLTAPVYVAMPDGRHVLLYTVGSNRDFNVYQKRYDTDGTAIDSTSVALTSGYDLANGFASDLDRAAYRYLGLRHGSTEGMAAVAISDNKYAMLYMSLKGGWQNITDMYARVYDFDTGRAVGAEVKVNTEIAGIQAGAKVLRLKEGGLIAVWVSDHTGAPKWVNGGLSSMDDFNVYARRFAWDEATQSIVAKDPQEVRVNTTTDGVNGMDFNSLGVHFGAAALAHGGYVVVWSKFTSDAASEVYGQTFDAAGNKLGGETLISGNSALAIDIAPDVTALPDGGYTVTWMKSHNRANTVGGGDDGFLHGGTIQSIVVNADGSIRGSGDTKTYPVTASYIDGGGTLNGNDAVNTLDGRKGASVLNAGGGNDYIIIKDTSFTSVDGGAGNDTLIWDSTQNLNFSDVAAKVKNIETIHLGDKNANTLKLSLSDVLGASGTTDTLVVLGGRTDRVVLEDSWSLAGSQVWRGEKYNVYSNKEDGAASLWVQAGVSVDMTAALRTNDAEPDADGAIFISPLGAKDTVLYKLLAADHATGGNDVDALDLFTVGDFEGTADANRIDLKELLVGYMADADGAARYIEGVATIDAGDSISEYLSTTVSGGNTMLSIDRDGSGNAYSATPLVTLNGVTTDLATLLANHQLVLA